MYITICEIDDQSEFDALNRAFKASALGQPRGMGWGERWEGGLGRGNIDQEYKTDTHTHTMVCRCQESAG